MRFGNGRPRIRMANLEMNEAIDTESQEGSSLVWKEDVQSLPPLPTPVYSEMRAEAACGCTLVMGIITVLVGSTHASLTAMTSNGPSELARTIGLGLIWGEAFIAILCLLGLMWGDPGAPLGLRLVSRPPSRQTHHSLPRALHQQPRRL